MMCGIAGAMSTYLSGAEIDAFKTLMKLSVVRGEDGAGVLAVSMKGKTNILKTLWSSYDIVGSEEFRKMHQNQKGIMLGHARWPTRGKVDDLAMVHPHRCGHIVGVHNGTLDKLNGEAIPAGQSDSRMLFESFEKIGVVETIKKTEGAYALVWADEKEGTINFLRNEHRPLFFGYHSYLNDDKPSTLYWASDDRFLDIALRRGDDKSLRIKPLPTNQWLRYPLKTVMPVVPIQTEEVKPDPKPVQTYDYSEWEYSRRSWRNDSFWDDMTFDHRGSGPAPTSRAVTVAKPNALGKEHTSFFQNLFARERPVDKGNTLEETSKGHYVTKTVFASYLDRGCVYCGKIPGVKDIDDKSLSWITTNQYLCLECKTDPSLPSVIH